jgi:hypothetical protein
MANLFNKMMLGLRAIYEEEDASFATITEKCRKAKQSVASFGVLSLFILFLFE